MICMCLSTVKIRGSDGVVRKIGKGATFTPKDPEVVKPLIEKGIVKIVESSPDISPGRRKTLELVLDAILTAERDEVIKSERWQPTPETRAIEVEIDAMYQEVLDVKCKLADFKTACTKWRKSGAEMSLEGPEDKPVQQEEDVTETVATGECPSASVQNECSF